MDLFVHSWLKHFSEWTQRYISKGSAKKAKSKMMWAKTPGTDDYGLSVLPMGRMRVREFTHHTDHDDPYGYIKHFAMFWTSTPYPGKENDKMYDWDISDGFGGEVIDFNGAERGMSLPVRCVRPAIKNTQP
jgi:uncharacterized protein (TIGR02145 family)